MLEAKRIKQVQNQLKPYHAQIFTSPKTDNAIILTSATNLHSIIRVQLLAKDHRWIKLVNQQFIHAQRFTDQDYNLNFNFRRHNAIDNQKRDRLDHDLLANFSVQITKTGQLTVNIHHDVVGAFLNLMNAILYLQNHGSRYLIRINPVTQADQQLRRELQSVNYARQSYRKAKNHGQSSHKRRPNHRPKAHGRVVAGFSSTAGTPREIRYARERKAKQKRQIFLSKHPEIVRQHRKQRIRRLRHHQFDLKNKEVVLAGRLTKPRTYYQKLMQRLNGKIQQRVNGQTDYLICNHPNRSHNYLAAKQRHVKIISENQIANSNER